MSDAPGAAFRKIQRQAACVFAFRARIEAVPPFPGTDGHAAGQAALRPVADFAARAEAEELDGLLIELVDPLCGESLPALATTVRDLLSGLIAADGGCPQKALTGAGSEHWWLTLCGTRWFALAFAPCYPPESPRFTFDSCSTFVLLQPVNSFDRRATPKGAVISSEIRERIRHAYAADGCPYDPKLAQQDVEALKFVWPLLIGDEPVRWWHGVSAASKGAT